MSGKRCSREGCWNYPCDRWSGKHGHICDYCFNELVHSGGGTDIQLFMQSEPEKLSPEAGKALEIYEQEFALHGDWNQ